MVRVSDNLPEVLRKPEVNRKQAITAKLAKHNSFKILLQPLDVGNVVKTKF